MVFKHAKHILLYTLLLYPFLVQNTYAKNLSSNNNKPPTPIESVEETDLSDTFKFNESRIISAIKKMLQFNRGFVDGAKQYLKDYCKKINQYGLKCTSNNPTPLTSVVEL